MSDSLTSPWLSRLKRVLPPCLLLFAVCLSYLYYHSEPRYQGRRFSEWMRFYEQGVDADRAELAIYAMGTEAVPHLVYCLTESKPGLLGRMIMSVHRFNPTLGFQLGQLAEKLPGSARPGRQRRTGRQSLIARDLLQHAPDTWKSTIVSAMKDLLENGSKYQQRPALRVMESFVTEARPLIPALGHLLKSRDVDLLVPTLDLMRDMGEMAAPLGPDLIPLFAHPDQAIQSKAVIVGSRIKIDPYEAMPALKSMLDSVPGGHRRLVAVQTLSEIAVPEPEQMQCLVDALDDPSEDVRNYAAYGLGRLGEDAIGSLDALIPLLKDEVIGVRATAATAIGNMGPAAKSAVPQLFETMNNDFSGVGQECRMAIEKIDPEQAKFIIVR